MISNGVFEYEVWCDPRDGAPYIVDVARTHADVTALVQDYAHAREGRYYAVKVTVTTTREEV